MPPKKVDAKTKILDAALQVIRTKGYAATTVDDLCKAAGVTKGAFFHHFKSKDDLAVAAAQHFSDMAQSLFADAPYRTLPDPVDRLLAYVDFRKAILDGPMWAYTCLLGTMVQETYDSNPAIRDACQRGLDVHADALETDIAAAIQARGLDPGFSAKSLALYMQAALQGSFILAKAWNNRQMVVDCLDHLKRYIAQLFETAKPGAQS
jgi:TetR/AcrR family transcriptional repressor of nem operon